MSIHAILHTLEALAKRGFEVTLLEIPDTGIISPDQVRKAIRPDTCLVSVMFANNEIGTIQPISEIGALCQEAGVLFHTDAVQAVGHIPVQIQDSNIDLLSLSGHKFHGPKGLVRSMPKKASVYKTSSMEVPKNGANALVLKTFPLSSAW